MASFSNPSDQPPPSPPGLRSLATYTAHLGYLRNNVGRPAYRKPQADALYYFDQAQDLCNGEVVPYSSSLHQGRFSNMQPNTPFTYDG